MLKFSKHFLLGLSGFLELGNLVTWEGGNIRENHLLPENKQSPLTTPPKKHATFPEKHHCTP